MKTLILAAAAAIASVTAATPAESQIRVVIGDAPRQYEPRHGYYNPNDYMYCRRPNGKLGIVTDHYGRPVTRYSYNYYNRQNLNYLRCSKVRGYMR